MQERRLVITTDNIYSALLFIIIYCSHDTLLFGTNSDALFISLRKSIPFLLCCILLVLDVIERKKFNLNKVLLGSIVILLPIASCFVNHETVDNYLYRLAIMLCAFILEMSVDKEKICRDYCSIMIFLSLWSVCFFSLPKLAPSVISALPKIINSSGYVFFFALFSVGEDDMRNTGIFREPGVFVVFLTIAIILTLLYDSSKKRKKHLIVFTITMLTTLSTAGYIILTVFYCYLILVNKEIKHKTIIVILISFVLLVLITQTNILQSDGRLFNKFKKGTNVYGSWFARLSSLTQNLSIAIKNPLFGVGRYTLYGTVLAENGVYAAIDNTNTILIGFASYGFLFGIFLVLGCWNFIKSQTSDFVSTFFLFIVLFMALSNEDMGQNIIFYFIVFSGLGSMVENRSSDYAKRIELRDFGEKNISG